MNDDKLKELETKLADTQQILDAMKKREFDYEAREEERKRKDAALGIALGLEFMDDRIKADTDPRWLAFRTTMERAAGAGWFDSFFAAQSKRGLASPASWLMAIEKAVKIRTEIAEIASEPPGNFRELYAEIGQWLETEATKGFRAARATGEF